MLACNLSDVKKNDYLSERFRKAYAWLESTDLESLEEGNYPIDGDDVYAQVHLYETKPAESAKFEAHDIYYDLHYIVSGRELFLVAPREGLEVVEGDKSRDIVFLTEPDHYSSVVLTKGDFVAVPPEEAHKPSLSYEGPEHVRKIVVKIKR
jgi:biofilm protein TabA